MPKKFPKILLATFCLLLSACYFFAPLPLQAAPDTGLPKWTMPDLQIDIGGLKGKFSTPTECGTDANGNKKYCINWISEYIAGIYKYAIGIVGILATVVMMVGGIIWLTAGGNATRVGEAKSWIGASLTGLVIALASYMILYQVNPDLIKFKPIKVTLVKKVEAPATGGGCVWGKLEYDGEGGINKCAKNFLFKLGGDKDCSGSKPADDYGCCCPQCHKNIPCDFCNDCVVLGVSFKDGDMANTTLVDKLKTISAGNWEVTEAWPPFGVHESSCHKNGTCVDIGLTGDSSVSNVNQIYNNLKSASFGSMQLESDSCSSYSNISGLKCVSCGGKCTGPHFHVNN